MRPIVSNKHSLKYIKTFAELVASSAFLEASSELSSPSLSIQPASDQPPAPEQVDVDVIGSDAEAIEAMKQLQKEAAAHEEEPKVAVSVEGITAHINPLEMIDLDKEVQNIELTDFSQRPHITFKERLMLKAWLEKNRPMKVDPDDVRNTSLLKLAAYTWELVPEMSTVPMYGTADGVKEMDSSANFDIPYNGPLPSSHPMDSMTTRVMKGRFNPMRDRGCDYKYPEFEDLYVNIADPEISVYLISAEDWNKMREDIINPSRVNSDGSIEHFYPLPVPHTFDLNSVVPPDDKEEIYGVNLKQWLKHPYDWHIFRAPLTALQQDEVDRIVHIAQSMIRNHKARKDLAMNLWARFTIKLTAFDPAIEVPTNLQAEVIALPFYKGRHCASNFFHRHHKKMRADQLIKEHVDAELSKFDAEDVARQRKYKDFLEREQVEADVQRQLTEKRAIDEARAAVKWWMAPWYLLQAMLRS